MYWMVRFLFDGPGKKKRKKGRHVAYSCRTRQVICSFRHNSFPFCFTSVIYFHASAIKNPNSAEKIFSPSKCQPGRDALRLFYWRTRQILLISRSISSRIVMFTQFSSHKRSPDPGKNVQVGQSFWLVRQKMPLQPFYFRQKRPTSGIILPGHGKNMRALPVT